MIATEYRTLIDSLNCAPASRLFVTAWLDEDEREIVTFGEFRRRARLQAALLGDHGVGVGDRVVIVMPQGISAMAIFVGAMMPVSYTHLRAHETVLDLVCRLLLE